MISFDSIKLHFSNMGVFYTTNPWLHPTRTIDSYELIYVVKGDFALQEDNKLYYLHPNNFLLLHPGIQHGGIKKTQGTIKFFWLHFYCESFDKLQLEKLYANPDIEKETYLFQEIMSAQQSEQQTLCDIKLAEILLKLAKTNKTSYPKVVYELMEYIRVNSHKNLSVNQVCNYFNYSPDHCSKLFKKHLGVPLSTYINDQKINYIKSLLLTTTLSIKDIAYNCNFEYENLLTKFFKYKTGMYPTQYRNMNAGLHSNNK